MASQVLLWLLLPLFMYNRWSINWKLGNGVPEPQRTHSNSFFWRRQQKQTVRFVTQIEMHTDQPGNAWPWMGFPISRGNAKNSVLSITLYLFLFRCLLPTTFILCLLIWRASLHVRAVTRLFIQQSSWKVLIKVVFEHLCKGLEQRDFAFLACPAYLRFWSVLAS